MNQEPLSKVEFDYISSIEKLNTLVEALKADNKSLTAKLDEKQNELSEMLTKNQELQSTATEQLEKLKKQHETLQADNQSLNTQIKEGEAHKADKEALTLQVADRKKEFSEMIAKNENAHRSFKDDIVKLTKENTALKAEMDNLNQRVLPEADREFFLACKADVWFDMHFKKEITVFDPTYLEKSGFPSELIPNGKDETAGLTTSNYMLTKDPEEMLFNLKKLN